MNTNVKDLSLAFQLGVKFKKDGQALEEVVSQLDAGSGIYADMVAGYQCRDLDLLKRLETEGCFVTDIFEFSDAYSTKR